MTSAVPRDSAADAASPYPRIDAISEEVSRAPGAFSSLVAAEPRTACPQAWQREARKHDLIRAWQETCLRLLAASIRGELSPAPASAVLDHLPDHLGWQHHARINLQSVNVPVFFRTDQATDGTILEVQCPGSTWGVHEIVHAYYCDAGFDCARAAAPLSRRFAEALHAHLRSRPVIHHLMDNSSHPAGERFFVHRVRPHAAYFGFDRDVRPGDCNFVRAHDFFGLMIDNFAAERLRLLDEGHSIYDLPPIALFDQKLLLAMPYWDETRAYFTDAIRGLFPYTAIVTPGGLRLECGDWVTLEQLSTLPRSRRRYFLKYAGADVARNWGSRAVFRMDQRSREGCLAALQAAVRRYSEGERWILQCKCAGDEQVSFITRSGTIATITARSKHSSFFGPTGLMASLVMFEQFYKVHMRTETIVGIVLPPTAPPARA
jgi:hypothetical protein